MSLWDFILPDPENKSICFTIPRPVYNAIKTYAYMEQIETDDAIKEAIIFFLGKKLYINKENKEPEFKQVKPHLYVRQMK